MTEVKISLKGGNINLSAQLMGVGEGRGVVGTFFIHNTLHKYIYGFLSTHMVLHLKNKIRLGQSININHTNNKWTCISSNISLWYTLTKIWRQVNSIQSQSFDLITNKLIGIFGGPMNLERFWDTAIIGQYTSQCRTEFWHRCETFPWFEQIPKNEITHEIQYNISNNHWNYGV